MKDKDERMDHLPIGLKTPTSNIKSQSFTPVSSESKDKQNDLVSLKEQIASVRAELQLSSANQETVTDIVSKLNSLLDTYEKVAAEYEALLKQSIMAKKAGKLDGSINRLEVEKNQLSAELERMRTELYNEIQSKEQLKMRLDAQEASSSQIQQRLHSEERARLALEEENQRLRFENTKAKTELDVEHTLEEEQRRRAIEHDNQIRELKLRYDAELHQKKLQVADLQNEVALLKQTEKILEEELKSRTSRIPPQDESELQRENRLLTEQVAQYRRQSEEYRKRYDDLYSAKQLEEDSYRKEIEAIKQRHAEAGARIDEQQLADLNEKLRKARSENEELSRSLKTARNEADRLVAQVSELESRVHDKDKRIVRLAEHVRELEQRVLEESTVKTHSQDLENEVKLLSEQLADARIRLNAPNEQVNNLKRKISLIEREKELLEEQLRHARVAAVSQNDPHTFSGFIQSLKRHIDTEVLSLEPMKMTLSDVIRSKEIVDILTNVTEDVRIKVLSHLGQVEEVIRQRQPTVRPSFPAEPRAPETVKIDRSRNFELVDGDVRRRLDFRADTQDPATSSRYLREPLGVVNTSIFSKNFETERSATAAAPPASLVSAGSNGPISDYLRPLPTQPSYGTQYSRQNLKVQEPMRCNLCHEYGHDSLSCTDYLSSSENDDAVLNDLRNNLRINRSSRFYNIGSR